MCCLSGSVRGSYDARAEQAHCSTACDNHRLALRIRHSENALALGLQSRRRKGRAGCQCCHVGAGTEQATRYLHCRADTKKESSRLSHRSGIEQRRPVQSEQNKHCVGRKSMLSHRAGIEHTCPCAYAADQTQDGQGRLSVLSRRSRHRAGQIYAVTTEQA